MKKTRAAIDEIESKNTLDNINKAKTWSCEWYNKKKQTFGETNQGKKGVKKEY